MTAWYELFRRLREQEHLSRDGLAALSGVSSSSIRSYERGDRHPTRASLVALTDALNIDAFARREILSGAGFAPDGVSPAERLQNEWFTLSEAAQEVARVPHPACITTEDRAPGVHHGRPCRIAGTAPSIHGRPL